LFNAQNEFPGSGNVGAALEASRSLPAPLAYDGTPSAQKWQFGKRSGYWRGLPFDQQGGGFGPFLQRSQLRMVKGESMEEL
jgi:hypothetical protein